MAEPSQSGSTDPSPPATTAPPPPPEYVESDTCRSGMTPLVDVMLANDTDSLAYETFHARFQELDRKMDRALLACSNEVAKPATKVVYEYSLANLAWGFCGEEKCATELIRKHLRSGNGLAHVVKAKVEATR